MVAQVLMLALNLPLALIPAVSQTVIFVSALYAMFPIPFAIAFVCATLSDQTAHSLIWDTWDQRFMGVWNGLRGRLRILLTVLLAITLLLTAFQAFFEANVPMLSFFFHGIWIGPLTVLMSIVSIAVQAKLGVFAAAGLRLQALGFGTA